MNKVWLALILLLLVSCENEVGVNMDNNGLPVAYCILDRNSTVQTVRLAKSFFPETGYTEADHLTLERWDEPVEIYIEEWSQPDKPVSYDFLPVDTIRQDTGYFTNPSFSLFESAFSPLPNVRYILYLSFPERNYHAFASTTVVDMPSILNPAAIPGRKITFSDADDFVVEIRPPANAGYHQFSFILNVEEHVTNQLRVDHFNFGGQIYKENSEQILIYQLSSARFYSDLLARYDTLTGSDFRRINGLEFVVYSYGTEMMLYNQLYNNGSQPWEIQSYSSFKNGFGLFSSVAHSRLTNLELSKLTYQILTGDSRYKHLNFVK
jgi:hypothetical protein